jgi:hypothetical protein
MNPIRKLAALLRLRLLFRLILQGNLRKNSFFKMIFCINLRIFYSFKGLFLYIFRRSRETTDLIILFKCIILSLPLLYYLHCLQENALLVPFLFSALPRLPQGTGKVNFKGLLKFSFLVWTRLRRQPPPPSTFSFVLARDAKEASFVLCCIGTAGGGRGLPESFGRRCKTMKAITITVPPRLLGFSLLLLLWLVGPDHSLFLFPPPFCFAPTAKCMRAAEGIDSSSACALHSLADDSICNDGGGRGNDR